MRAAGSLGQPRHTLPEALQIQPFSKPQAGFYFFNIKNFLLAYSCFVVLY